MSAAVRLFNPDFEPYGIAATGGRITTPATSAATPLRKALVRMQADFPGLLQDDTWDQYWTIVRKWEEYHSGPGPSVDSINCELLDLFVASVSDWRAPSTWRRIDAQIGAMLKSCCLKSRKNRCGLATPILRMDELPFITVPEDHWFAANRPGSTRSGGHTPKRRGSLTLDRFQKVIDACWSIGLKGHADFVETVLGWWWWSGMRFTQTLEKLTWCEDGVSDGVDLDSLSLVTSESKCGGEIRVPIPTALGPGLRLIKRQSDSPLVFYRPRFKDRALRNVYERVWQKAYPAATEAEAKKLHWLPHQLRAVSVSIWDNLPPPACNVGWLVTGHSPGNVRQAAYSRPTEAEFRRIVDDVFPMPVLKAGTYSTVQRDMF